MPLADGVFSPKLESEQHTCGRAILNVINKSYFESHPLLYINLNTFLSLHSNADQKQKPNMKYNILISQSQN